MKILRTPALKSDSYTKATYLTSNQLELESITICRDALVDHVANNHRHGAAGAISAAICVDVDGLIDRAGGRIGRRRRCNPQVAANRIKTMRLEC